MPSTSEHFRYKPRPAIAYAAQFVVCALATVCPVLFADSLLSPLKAPSVNFSPVVGPAFGSNNPTDLRWLLKTEAEYEKAANSKSNTALSSEVPVPMLAIDHAKDQLATARSVAGDYLGALQLLQDRNLRIDLGQSLPDQNSYSTADLREFEPRDAIASIVEMARSRQIVILNEAHHVSRHRAFALKLAEALREIGFSYLACETFNDFTEETKSRGYPNVDTGSYTREPLFADFVRRSLAIGYTPIAYEYRPPSNSSVLDAGAAIGIREQAQAENLMRRIFTIDPKAKVLIYVGYSHLRKEPNTTSLATKKELRWMASRLKTLSGLDPLTVDQTSLTDPPSGSAPANYLDAAIALNPAQTAKPLVLRSKKTPDKFRVAGQYAGDVDMQVLHPRTRTVNGRPDWLAMDGYRRVLPIPEDIWPIKGRRLVQAFVPTELQGAAHKAIPLDQIVVTPDDRGRTTLMVPKGEVVVRFVDAIGLK
jgi:hypothetical protein